MTGILRRVARSGVVVRRLLTVLLLLLAGCAGRAGTEVLSVVDDPIPDGAKVVTIYAATTRHKQGNSGDTFVARRSAQTNYARFELSIPPDHKAGEIEWPKGRQNLSASFAVIRRQDLPEDAFFRMMREKTARQEPALFIHGYNVSYQEAVYRLAQMTADSDAEATPLLFSWPSRATISGYGADREAVTASRDQLAAFLTELTASSRAPGGVTVMAHSLGCWLTMEALRQLKLQGRDDVLARLKVYLASPDIDEDVFATQLAAVGRMRDPITLLVSKDDRALKVSSLLTGDTPRIGALDVTDPQVIEAARRKGVQIIDIGALKTNDSFHHDRYASLAAQTAAWGRDGDDNWRTPGEAGAFIFEVAGTAIASPFRLASKIVSP